MKRLLRIGIVAMAAAVVLLAASQDVRAQRKWPTHAVPKASSGSTKNDPSRSQSHTLLKTYFTQNSEDEGYESPREDLAVDSPTSFFCSSPLGCTLEIEQSLSVGGVDSIDNWCGPFAQVDGNWTEYGPPAGETPADESYITITGDQTTWVSYGKHTVQSFVYSWDGLYIWAYHMTYRLYVP